MKKFIIYIFFIFVPFLFNSFANSSPFEEKFGKIIPIDTNFLFKPIILKCNKNSQEGQDGQASKLMAKTEVKISLPVIAIFLKQSCRCLQQKHWNKSLRFVG